MTNSWRNMRIAALVVALLGGGFAVGGFAALAAPLEKQISFAGAGGVAIAGTLELPEAAGADHPAPALLLLQGSGPTDRDGNQPTMKTDLVRQLADILAENGIASLRYDKRGMYANRPGMPAQAEALPAFFAWTAFVGDARAAFLYLAHEPAVAAGRVGIFGHSEGGIIALDLAAGHSAADAAEADAARRIEPKLLVLAGTPGRPLGAVIHDQLAALLERQHATAEQRDFFLAADARIRAQIIADGRVPLDVPAGLAALYPAYLGPFLQSVLPLDPPRLAAAFKGPILVINGAADSQVSATRDTALLAAALAARPDTKVLVAPDVSHNLKTLASPDDPGVTGSLDARVKDTLVGWLKSAL